MEAEARAALGEDAATQEELEEATQAPAPGAEAGDAAAGSHPAGFASGSSEWLGADPDAGPPAQPERFPERLNIFQGQLTLPEDLLRVKEEPRERQ